MAQTNLIEAATSTKSLRTMTRVDLADSRCDLALLAGIIKRMKESGGP
jgi:hypothetical protein